MKRFQGMLILSDMDGTLLDSMSRVSAGNRQAIRYFMDHGGRFSVATGRVRHAMEYFLDQMPINAPAVIYNGSVVYDFEAGRPVKLYPIGELGREIAGDVMEHFPQVGVEVYLAEEEFVARNTPLTQLHFERVRVPLIERDMDLIPQPWIKLNLTVDPGQSGPLSRYLEEKYGGRAHMQHSLPQYYEIMSRDCHKGAAALAVCAHMGIDPGRLYTVGDGRNDLELLGCTDHSYAPANAHPEILRAARHHLPDCDHDAIAALIGRLDEKYR